MDTVAPAVRRRMMQAIKSKDTGPEKTVRSIAHRAGLRFRLHVKDLPGRPDLVFPRHRTAVFVHGCFWHRHGCSRAAVPKTRPEFWAEKFARNVARDQRQQDELARLGWTVLVIWECETRRPCDVLAKLATVLPVRRENLSAGTGRHRAPSVPEPCASSAP